jgi:hypothetical protein
MAQAPKLKATVTNTKGQRVRIYNDGSKTYDGEAVPTTAAPDTAANATAETSSGKKRTVINTPPTQEDKAEAYLGSFKEPDSEEDVISRLERESRDLIRSTEETYDTEYTQEKRSGAERLGQTNALLISSGLQGSTEAVNDVRETTDLNNANLKEITNRKRLALAKIYDQIRADARAEVKAQRDDATKSAESIMVRKKEARDRALENVKYLAAAGGVDYDAFKGNPQNKETYEYALNAFDGNEEALKGYLALNRPKDEVVTSKWAGNRLFQVYRNPITGALKTESVNLEDLGYDIPKEYTRSVDLGDKIMFIPDSFDPSRDTPYYVGKGLTPNQASEISEDGSGALGKLTDEDKRDLVQAGLNDAGDDVKSYFLNTPVGFRDEIQRKVASKEIAEAPSIETMNTLYNEWYAKQQATDMSDYRALFPEE